MKGEIEKVLSTYPKEDALESTVENSRWVRITYGFAVITNGEANYFKTYLQLIFTLAPVSASWYITQ